MCSDAPEPDKAIGQAARDNVNLGREAMQYYREKDKAGKPRQDKLDAIAMELADQQIQTSKVNTAAANEQLQRYRSTGVAAEDQMYADAKNYDTTERQEQEAGKAATDVDFAMGAAADTKRRTLARAGVNPADGRALAMEDEMAASAGLGKAAAMNGARTRVKDMGIMLRKDAANFARGMSSSAAQTYGVASASGQGATGAITSAANADAQRSAQMGAGFGMGMQGNSSGGSLLLQDHQAKLAAANSGGIGDILGSVGALGQGIGAIMSDENEKKDIAPVDDDKALSGIAKLGVKSWKYKDDSVAADGGQEHIGPMAQDMQKNLGDTVAPGGKMVDMVSGLGVTMAAIKALNKKVDKMAAGKAGK